MCSTTHLLIDTFPLPTGHSPPLAQFFYNLIKKNMQNWLRTLIAGWGAYKLGGGCLGFIAVFAILYWLLGYC